MRTVLVVLLTLLGAGNVADESFATRLPDGITDLSRWELVSGTFANARVEGAYRFYVNPERAAIYQLMRYRIRFLAPATDVERQYRPTEKLVWNTHPGERRPLRCFEHVSEGPGGRWREIPHGNSDYTHEMWVLMQVLSLHRAARLAQ